MVRETGQAVTEEPPAQAKGLVARHQPTGAERLQPRSEPLKTTDISDAGASASAPARPGLGRPAKRKSKLSFLKRLERNILAFFKLGRIEAMAKQARGRLDHMDQKLHRVDSVDHRLGALGDDVAKVWASISQLEAAHEDHSARFDVEYEKTKAGDAVLARTVSDVTRRLDNILLYQDKLGLTSEKTASDMSRGSDGMEAFLDSFYHRLENKYRGSVEEIANRLRIYLPDVEAAVIRTGRKPVMDLGCGRGEWLGLLTKADIPAFGVDINPVQIAAAQEAGLDVRLGDSLDALAALEDNSLSVITAHHLVEHLPFDKVAWIAREAMRVLSPGGLLMFETPHTRNVLVGATTFHTDPTHLKPMPEQVLGVLFETAGFHPIEIRALHAHERFDEFIAQPDFNNELAFLMFGPQDLAVLGTKPTGD